MTTNTQIRGSLAVTRQANIAGNVTAAGDLTVKGRLRVEGWLDAPNLKGPCKGLYATGEALSQAYPEPQPGWWALVGSSIPAQIYTATTTGWADTGQQGGTVTVDLNHYDDAINTLHADIQAVADQVSDIEHPVTLKECNADLILADEAEHPIAIFADGHVRTSCFDSSSIITAETLPISVISGQRADLILADEEQNPIATFADGHIRTANFDSSSITLPDSRPLAGKLLSIIGDSISTFAGYLPEGYVAYYPYAEMQDVRQTWWHKLATQTGMTVLKNCSWSGSCICGNNLDPTGAVGCSNKRVADLADGDTTPDIVLIYIGTNDWGNHDTPAGTWSATERSTVADTVGDFSQAYAMLVERVMTAYPLAKVVCCTLVEHKAKMSRVTSLSWPLSTATGQILEDYNEKIRQIARHYGATLIDAHACGINYYNVSTYLMADNLHHNEAGASKMAAHIAAALTNQS